MLTTPYLANSAKTKSMRLQGELSASINSAIFSVMVSIEIYMGSGQQRKGCRDSFCSFRHTASFRGMYAHSSCNRRQPSSTNRSPSLLHTRKSFTYWDKVILPSMEIHYCLCRSIVTTSFSSQFATLSKLLSHLWWVLSNRVEDAPQIQESGTIKV
jgi:hypothetical protein